MRREITERKMDRPKITKEMVLEAAKEIAEKLDGDAETIADHYRHPMDVYELARELDRYAGWDLTMPDVEELDCLSSIVSDLHRKAEKKWVEENDIQPPLPIGTRIKQGVVAHEVQSVGLDRRTTFQVNLVPAQEL